MSLSPNAPATGRITRGIAPNTFVDQAIDFVRNELHVWRDDASRPFAEAEEDLNGQLCKYLNDRARHNFPMAFFHHEEKQGKRRRVDISVLPSSTAIEAAFYDSIYEPFLVMEGKRLPAPDKSREREYLTGLDKKSGGVQRFRLCLHGGSLATAVMIAYVQTGDVTGWLKTINGWIADLQKSDEDSTCSWSDEDHLADLEDDGKTFAARCQSQHSRVGGLADIRLVHLWIHVPPISQKRGRARKRA